MQKTNCRRLVTTHHSLGSLIDGIKAGSLSQGTDASQLQLDMMPTLKDLYPMLGTGSPDENFLPYPPQASRSSPDDILYYLHSSGSTGFPKAIPTTHQTIIGWCRSCKLLTQSTKQSANWCGISMCRRPYQRSHSSPHCCCICSTVPYHRFTDPTTGTHGIFEQHIHLPTHILPRPISGPNNTQFPKYPGLRA